MTEVDYLIAGQGLAGTVFAWTALRRGRSVLLADPEPETNTSRAAAGLVNPILGPRLSASWRFRELWSFAVPFYRDLEQILGVPFLHETALVRFFVDPAQRALWLKKRDRPEYAGFWEPCQDRSEETAFLCPGAAWLDIAAFVNASARRLRTCLERIDPAQLLEERDSVRWGGVRARHLVFCEGHALLQNPLFRFIPARSGLGHILTLTIPGWGETRILHRVKWVLPIGGQRFRLGATYDWPGTPGGVSPEPPEDRILAALRPILPPDLPPPPYAISAGIRPMAKHGVPFLGRHPVHPRFSVLNGLGAKGVLLAPFFAHHLLDHLESGAPLDAEVDVRQFGNR